MKRTLLKRAGVPNYVWWVIAILLLIIIGFQARGVWERYIVEREMSERRSDAEETLSNLQQKKATLQEQVQYMTNERGVEEELRQNFDVALPGERVFILTGEKPKQTSNTEAATSTDTTRNIPWYRFW